MSEITETILKLGGLINLLILIVSLIDRPEPSEKTLKEHLKDVLKIMAGTSTIFLVIAFLSHMEVLRSIMDFMRSKTFLIPMITLTTAVPILLESFIRINKINRHNYKKEIGTLLFVTIAVITVNQVVYFVLTHDLVPVAT
mgnify:CR=1 FL=1